MKSLFLCTTPLQVRISQEIIRRNSLDGHLVYIVWRGLTDDDANYLWKQQPYIDACDRCIQLNEDVFDYELERLVGFYEGIYLASFDNLFLKRLAQLHPGTPVYGFDDGMASVFEQGMYMQPAADYLKARVVKHYTIYKTDFHVIEKDKLEYIPIGDVFEFPKTRGSSGKELVVFLGEGILANPELGLSHNQAYVDQLQPDWYIPHPKARFEIKYDKILNEPKLFEELVAEWLGVYSKIIVYHFSSSAGLHLKDIDGLEFRGIRVDVLTSRQLEMMNNGMSFNRIPLTNWF